MTTKMPKSRASKAKCRRSPSRSEACNKPIHGTWEEAEAREDCPMALVTRRAGLLRRRAP